MDLIILEFVKSFKSNTKNLNKKYEQFLFFVYSTLDEKINASKITKIRNKYIQIRKTILQYLVANKKNIINKIK